MSDHVHSDACCRLTIRTEEPLLLTSVGCLVCGRDTTKPVKLMYYVTDEVLKPVWHQLPDKSLSLRVPRLILILKRRKCL